MTYKAIRNLSYLIICITGFTFLCPRDATAQIDTARIVGTIQDTSGAAVPDCDLMLTNINTGVLQKAQSTSGGTYIFESVPPGQYTLEAERAGFKTYVGKGITVHVQNDLRINIRLELGTISQQVTVSGISPVLQTENASLGQTVDSKQVNDLPLNGRDWVSLSQLAAGVTTVNGGTTGSTSFSVNGISYIQNDFLLNGINNNVEVWGAAPNVTPPPDAIEEFKLQTGDFSAEFGHSTGGIVNAVTKSGTNRLHGDAWEYARHNALDANDYFSKQFDQPKPAYRQNQYGGTIGGPVYIPKLYSGKNRTFFFFDYQGENIVEALGQTSTVPTQAMQSSNFTNLQDLITYNSGTGTDALGRVFPHGTVLDPATTRLVPANSVDPVSGLPNNQSTGIYVRDPFYSGGSIAGIRDFTSLAANLNQLPVSRVDPNAIALLQLYPTPNGSGLYSNYHNNAPLSLNTNQVDTRVDENINPSNILFESFDWEHYVENVPGTLPGIANGIDYYEGGIKYPFYAGAIGYTHVFAPTLTNDMHIGYNHWIDKVEPTEANTLGIPAKYGIQGIPQFPGNGGLTPIPIAGLTGLGTSSYVPTAFAAWVLELSDNLAKVHGKHLMKVGYQFDRIEGNGLQPSLGKGALFVNGQYTDIPNATTGINGVSDLLIVPTASTVPGGIPNVGGVSSYAASNFSQVNDERVYMGAYFQDDWRVLPQLTLNLGVRWDHYSLLTEKDGRQANFLQNGSTGTYQIPQETCSNPRSASFNALLQASGITVQCASKALGNIQNLNFAPRVGFAYSITPETVIRGGYGIAYGALDSLGFGQNLGNNYPFQYQVTISSPNSYTPITLANGQTATIENAFADGSIFSPLLVNGVGLGLLGRVYNFKTPYSQTLNLTLQRKLAHNDAFQIGYVGVLGRHLDTPQSVQNAPSKLAPPGASIYDYIPFPSFSPNAAMETTEGMSSYNSMQATYEHRLNAGLYVLANYTFSKCMTDQAPYGSTTSGFRAEWLPGFGQSADYALCDTDATNVVHISGTYELPFGARREWLNNNGRLVDAVLGGWSAGWIYTYQGGQPLTIPCPTPTNAFFGCAADVVPGVNIYGGSHDQKQWLNPNAFAEPPVVTTVGQSDYSPLGGELMQARGPGFNNIDFSLFKQFVIKSPSTFVQIRGDAFNLTNTPQFGQPGQLNFEDPSTFSEITSLRNNARLIQLSAKLVF